jgi:hypothetical protein
MTQEIQQLIDTYYQWLKDKSVIRQIDNWVEITTPYLDRHNDYVQIYAKKDNGGYLLTDDGYTISDLEMSGCNMNSQKRKDLLRMTLNGFGVRLSENNAIEVVATPDNFPIRKHNLVQAILATNDLFYLAKPMVSSLFFEDVVLWLNESRIRYTPNVKFTGKSGYDHHFDFVIPSPERIIRAITKPSRETASQFAFAWTDTKDVRLPNSRAFAMLNDSTPVSSSVVDALKNYDVIPVLWSHRNEVKKELAA